MAQADEVLRRLREDDEHLASLADLVIDQALTLPLRELVNPEFVSAAICKGLRTLSEQDELETWLVQRAERASAGTDEFSGIVGEHIPVTALAPLQTMLSREVTPDPALVRALLDHASLRALMRELLQANLLEFARRAKDVVASNAPKAATRGIGGMLGAVAKNVASAAGSAVEKQLEDKARSFVEDAIGVAVETTIDRFCSPDHAEEMATWRVDVLHAVLQQPVERLIAERHKYPPQAFAEDASGLIRAVAGWSELEKQIDSAVAFVIDEHGAQNAREWLAGSGLEAGLRDEVRRELVRLGRKVVDGDAFGPWLANLLA